ncbi:glycerol-3-phosphate 1-O-acyltransferase PlsY [Lactiplantibacillus pentosus]|uniref:glycerol-3-phosphate 1-O-acyltransferase PlsY n=1 Tax=Lactiplantibacillus pentosus TaxID=1589 RepID=UPI001C1F8FA5|nr:glycerol-3-phosphate 1-O-acyltransferase PlsY [Lactiplantibacillus pentosus]MBU7504651.1 glycerol-3-phosphate acyltransferase [Lactiplantibacillus pentosus]MDY1545198.1 glycerol-3-phosphate 1-O-acyltransferase PlsY [Lactiplantibacillus pentosus]
MKILIMLIVAYLIGSIPSGVIIGKLFFQTDIRLAGSGNIGTTNTYRVLGPTAGTIVMAMDILKGTIAALQPTLLFHMANRYTLLIGLAAILGHTFSIYIGFKGGKAVATSAGILLAYNWEFFLIASVIMFILVYTTSMVSVASMTAFPIVTLIAIFYYQDWLLSVVALVLTCFIFYRHRSNIARIKNGTESLVHLGIGWRRQQRANRK